MSNFAAKIFVIGSKGSCVVEIDFVKVANAFSVCFVVWGRKLLTIFVKPMVL